MSRLAPSFLLAAITASVLAACSDPYQHAGVNSSSSTAASATSTAVTPTPALSQPTTPATSDLDQTSPGGAGPSTADMQGAGRAARLFVGPYVLYTYGQGNARQIPAGDPSVIAQLTARPPSVPSTVGSRHPKVTSLSVSGGRAGQITFQADVSDGVSVYALPLTVTHEHNQWLVTSVQ